MLQPELGDQASAELLPSPLPATPTAYEAAGRPPELGPGTQLAFHSLTLLPIHAARLVPGRSYRLKVRLTNSAKGASSAKAASPANAGAPKVGIRFRERVQKKTYRSYWAESSGQLAELRFQAPAYVEEAELAFAPSGGPLAVEGASLMEAAAVEQNEAVASWSHSYVPPGYGLVFNDEFSGKQLNRSKWFTRYIYGGESLDQLSGELQRYTDTGTHEVRGGILRLVAKKAPPGARSPYESGMIRSDFTFRYGFVEARVKMPGGLGVWPAFWLNSDVSEHGRLNHPPEIDIFEFVNNGKDDKVDKVHIAASNIPSLPNAYLFQHERFRAKHRDYFAPYNFNDGFHTFGLEWTPTTLTTYVDGTPVVSTTFRWLYEDGELAAPAHILLNLAIGGGWAGRYGIDDSAFPQALEVDWVRVYRPLHEAQSTPRPEPRPLLTQPSDKSRGGR